MKLKLILILFFILTLTHCQRAETKSQSNPIFAWQAWLIQAKVPIYDYKIIATYPHDTSAYTEGLILENKILYESSGLYNQSNLRRSDLTNGKILQQINLPAKYFAEGISILNDKLYLVTYESNIGFVYNKNTFQFEKTFNYPTQGWGLTTDGKELIMSNGSAALIFMNPNTFLPSKYLIVNLDHEAIGFLNGLAYIEGKIYANIWRADVIAIISPQNGNIEGLIDLSNLNPKHWTISQDAVLNGIAYDPKDKTILVTGKNWDKIYKISLIKR